MHDHPDIGLGRCMVLDEHDSVVGVIGIEHRLTHERRLVFVCEDCHMAHATAQLASSLFGPGVAGILNILLQRVGVTEQVGIEMIEVAIETHPDSPAIEFLRASLRELRAAQNESVTPIEANEFARLMAATNVNAPKREEIN